MDANHTPGPWPAPEEDNSDRGPGSWYEVPGICNYVTKEADARLISVAPELLAFVQKMLGENATWCCSAIELHIYGADGLDGEKLREEAMALVAKATGSA
jgi:hypothetical protein